MKFGRGISPFRARATVLSRRLFDLSRQVFHNPTAMVGLVILVFFMFLAIAAP
ncbi:MAG: ABC transporter permease, partial [Methanobacteriota archaeon]